MVIVDSQSVKSHSPGSNEDKGYDGGKKVSGRKRHLATDSGGNPVAVGVSAANVHDKKGALTLKEQIDREVVEKKATGGRVRVLPKRWVVERTFAWLGNFRRLAKDYEKSTCMAKAMLLMASIIITLRKLVT